MSSNKIFIFDTSVLCCWLQVPGKDTCGPDDQAWDHAKIDSLVSQETKNGATFILPVASIIETGNHIAFTQGDRYTLANSLAEKMKESASEKTPWAAFSDQSDLWSSEKLLKLAEEWPKLAVEGLGIGDITIKDVAEFYASTGAYEVVILTGDKGLKAYEPAGPTIVPRRRLPR